MKRKFILNADDFGLSSYNNKAVLECYKKGIIKSTSIVVNTEEAFLEALDIFSACPNLSLGIHLNIFEGKPLTNCPKLINKKGEFKKSFSYLFFHQNNKELLSQIEKEFRAQIEKAIKYVPIEHIDSHVHTHGIPSIFNIAAKLAKEYNISFIRTQFEKPYLVFSECLSIKFLVNIIKIVLLNFYTIINRRKLKKLSLKTNDYIIGVGYSGFMNSKTINKGVEKIKQGIVEGIIHPYKTKEVDLILNTKTLSFREIY